MPYITFKGCKMHYREQGQGFPLLFGHSYLWDAAMWQPQVDALSAHYRCIMPELWAHGQSDPPPASPYSVIDMADAMAAFVDALELKRFAIIGLSVGGMWGTALTLKRPESVAALALFDTFVGVEPVETLTRYNGMLDMVEQAGAIPPPIIEAVQPLFFSPHTLQSASTVPDAFKQALATIPAGQIPGIVTIGRGIFARPSLLGDLNRIKVPTLVAVGAGDQSRPPHEAALMADALPHSRYEVIDAAGHISNLEQPERVTALLSDFLQQALA